MIKESKAYKYAKWCYKNEDGKVGRYVKKQAGYWIDIVEGKDDEAYIDKADFNSVLNSDITYSPLVLVA